VSDAKSITSINKRTVSLFLASLALNGIYLFFNYHNNYYPTLLSSHGEVGYNVYRYNSVKVNPERRSALCAQHKKLKRVVDYREIDPERFGPPTQYRSIQDTVGYGVLLG